MNILVISNIADKSRSENIVKQFESQLYKPKYEIMPAIMDAGKSSKGISQSHKACIQKAKDNNWPEVTIVEDDILFPNHASLGTFLFTFYAFKNACEDWDMYFGGIYEGELVPKYFLSEKLGAAKIEGKISGLHLYTVNSRFYDRFLSADEEINLDYVLSEQLKAVSYCVTPFLALQNDGYSYNKGAVVNYNEYIGRKYPIINPTPTFDSLKVRPAKPIEDSV